jgi:hypothetical protein
MGRTPQYLKKAILDSAEKKEGWFLARDIVAEVAGITGRLARPLNKGHCNRGGWNNWATCKTLELHTGRLHLGDVGG